MAIWRDYIHDGAGAMKPFANRDEACYWCHQLVVVQLSCGGWVALGINRGGPNCSDSFYTRYSDGTIRGLPSELRGQYWIEKNDWGVGIICCGESPRATVEVVR